METPNVQESTKQEQSANASAQTVSTISEEKRLTKCGTPQGDFSSPISVGDGHKNIIDYRNIQPELKKLSVQLPLLPNVKMFLENIADNNVFIFDRNIIERFNDKNLDFDYYAVCLGFNTNGATVIFGAFNEISKNVLQSIAPLLDADCSLSEHPQKKSIIDITQNFQKVDSLTIVL